MTEPPPTPRQIANYTEDAPQNPCESCEFYISYNEHEGNCSLFGDVKSNATCDSFKKLNCGCDDVSGEPDHNHDVVVECDGVSGEPDTTQQQPPADEPPTQPAPVPKHTKQKKITVIDSHPTTVQNPDNKNKINHTNAVCDAVNILSIKHNERIATKRFNTLRGKRQMQIWTVEVLPLRAEYSQRCKDFAKTYNVEYDQYAKTHNITLDVPEPKYY